MKKSFCLYSIASVLSSLAIFSGAIAQELETTPQTDAFVSHPNYCGQLIGGEQYRNDSVTAEMAKQLSAATASLSKLNAKEAMAEINNLCRAKLDARKKLT